MNSKNKRVIVVHTGPIKEGLFVKGFKDNEVVFFEALEALENLRNENFQLCIIHQNFSMKEKLSIIKQICQITENQLPIICILKPEEKSMSIEVIKKGAGDYLFEDSLNSFLLCLTGTKVVEQKKWELIYQDISEDEDAEAYALKDSETDLYNKFYLETRIQEEMTRSNRYHFPLTLISFSIDDMDNLHKQFNYSDVTQMIREMGNMFVRDLRSSDLLARINDNQFALLLPHTNTMQAKVVWKRMNNHIKAHPFLINEQNVMINLKASVTSLNQEIDCIDSLFDKLKSLIGEVKSHDDLHEFSMADN